MAAERMVQGKTIKKKKSFGERIQKLLPFRLAKGELPVGFVVNLAILMVFGLLILFSASYVKGYYKFNDPYHYIWSQFLIAAVGFGAMWVISFFDYRELWKYTWIIYGVAVGLMVWAYMCEPIYGCRRWIHGPNIKFTLQPGEIAKFAIMLSTAQVYYKNRDKLGSFQYSIILPFLITVPMLGLFYIQSHKSGMVILLCILFTMLAVGGAKLIHLIVTGLLGAGGMAMLLWLQTDYVADRLDTWSVNLDWDVLNYQAKQSILAIASGQLTGVGIGKGKQKHLWLPEAVNDYIFSVLCEELGFVGAACCIGLFAWLIIQGLMIALRAPDLYGVVLGAGIVGQIAWQVVLNLCVVTCIGPTTGISLPFFSDGGTSLLILLGELGVLLSIGRAGNHLQEQREAEAAEQERKEHEE